MGGEAKWKQPQEDPCTVDPDLRGKGGRGASTMRCPHCRNYGIRRSSREVTITFRQSTYVCGNPACGHTWVASTSYDYGLSPSAIPDESVDLPMRPMDRQALIRAPSLADDPDQPSLFGGPAAPNQPTER